MKELKYLIVPILTVLCFLCIKQTVSAQDVAENKTRETGTYTLIVEGYDWGPGASKVVLSLDETVSSVNKEDYSITVMKKAECKETKTEVETGERTILYAYVSDEKGKKVAEGNHLTLSLLVAPNLAISSPMQYVMQCNRNVWADYRLRIKDSSSSKIWNQEASRIHPLVDKFDLSGKFVSDTNIALTYADYTPSSLQEKTPLIIWLHGGGGEVNDMYNESLMALIKDYVAKHPNIDTDRIYLGGCSNGGYMSLKLMLLHPDYFAASFPSALAYHTKYITDKQIASIKDIPIWFIHSKDDPVTKANETVVPVYKRLIAAGAKNVHFSDYDHVVDITGFFGGEDYNYLGHFSWIYSHANHARLDYDGQAVRVEEKPVTLMEWLAAQRRGK